MTNGAETGANESKSGKTGAGNDQDAPSQEALLGRLMTAINNALELEIVTAVSDFTIDNFDDPKNAMQVKLGKKPTGYVTSISLLTGDIRNVISPDHAAGQNKELREFHTAQVALAREIVANNLKMVGELAEKLRGWIREDQSGAGGG